ncbi:EI24 domain-containing protein [Nocardiopsis alborubida]|uniref:EI24 domain-containing protein n=1 Tax=Nocardiopsis alborubida TaxID=146802 RepID=A0A7X6RQD8_9ACTN|nr:EI24 domain-containing protein [Nocardiopsis alborubida]NKY98558.1 EI24 domain-containing protein [Nocardiopsis alborubida]
MANPVREFLGGVGALLRGFTLLLRKPRLFLLGALPALITSLVFLALFVLLVVNLTDLADWATPFADGWDPLWQGLLRGAVSVAVLAGSLLLMVVGFTTVTLALGGPIYDKVTELVEKELGNDPGELDESLMTSMWRAVRQSLAVVAVSLVVTVFVFAIGFIPVVGQVAGPVLAAVLGGWLLAVELLASAFDRRRLMTIRERRRYMGTRRARVLGYAVPTYFLLAVPFLAVVVFPAATAGAVILTRELVPTPPHRPDPAGPLPGPGAQGGPLPGGTPPGGPLPGGRGQD